MGDREVTWSDDDESVAENSIKSDRTPSPSLLSGLQLLERGSKLEQQNDKEVKDPQKDYDSDKQKHISCIHEGGPGDERRYTSPICQPFFKSIHSYHHSPIFTPPRKMFLPADHNIGGVRATQVGVSAGSCVLSPEHEDVYSQALFSSTQGSHHSQSNAQEGNKQNPEVRHADYSGDQPSQFVEGDGFFLTQLAMSPGGSENAGITQDGNEAGKLNTSSTLMEETDYLSHATKSLPGDDGNLVSLTITPSDNHSPNLIAEQFLQTTNTADNDIVKTVSDNEREVNGELKTGSKSTSATVITEVSPSQQRARKRVFPVLTTASDVAQDEEVTNMMLDSIQCKRMPKKTEGLQLSQIVEVATPQLRVTPSAGLQDDNMKMASSGKSLKAPSFILTVTPETTDLNTSVQGTTEKNHLTKLIQKGAGPVKQSIGNVQPMKPVTGSEPIPSGMTVDSPAALDRLEREYQIVDEELRHCNATSFSKLHDKITSLKENLKDEAKAIQVMRGRIMRCTEEKMPTTQRNEQLLQLSMKQKQILHALSMHKKLAAELAIKMSSSDSGHGTETVATTLKEQSCSESEVAGRISGHGTQIDTTFREQCCADFDNKAGDGRDEERPTEEGSCVGDETYHRTQAGASYSLTLKDMIDNHIIVPGVQCLSFSGQDGRVIGELLKDGSVLSGNTWHKSEREWYASHHNLPVTTIKRPKLWNIILYNGKELNSLACQCHMICIAKKLKVPTRSAVLVTESKRVAEQSYQQEQDLVLHKASNVPRMSSKGLLDTLNLSAIKYVSLIGEDELFQEDNLLLNGFWDKDQDIDLIPGNWISDLTTWEE